MKKRNVFMLATILLILILSFGYYLLNPSLDRIPKGNLITKVVSPDGTYTIKAYEGSGGATVGYAVLGELVWNKTNKKKNVYWQYPQQKADIKWIDNNTVNINGKILKIPNEVYDYRDEN